jgi:hypothetical protein
MCMIFVWSPDGHFHFTTDRNALIYALSCHHLRASKENKAIRTNMKSNLSIIFSVVAIMTFLLNVVNAGDCEGTYITLIVLVIVHARPRRILS